jgi:hypothetical protein
VADHDDGQARPWQKKREKVERQRRKEAQIGASFTHPLLQRPQPSGESIHRNDLSNEKTPLTPERYTF